MALGFDQMPCAESAAAVEWADRAPGSMPEDTLWVQMGLMGQTQRSIHFRAAHTRGVRLLDAVRAWSR